MGWPDGPVGRGLNGLARPDIRPTDRAWAVRQARWTVQARPGGPAGQKGPSPIGPCLARARAVPCRAGPLLIFSRARRKVVRDLIVQERVSLVCLQETKLSNVSNQLASECLGASFEYAFLPTVNSASGVLLGWRTDA